MLFPNKTKYKKQFKGKLKGTTSRGSQIIFGKHAIKILETGRLTSNQIEAAEKVIIKKMKKVGFLWTRVFPDVPVTSKPTENRMGKGKGSLSFWVAKVRKGQILYEINGISYYHAKKIFDAGTKKLPIKTKFISK